MHSALYLGRVRHRRFAPRPHDFDYRLFMAYLDLSELDAVFRRRWLWSTKRPTLAWLRRADYLGDPDVPLDQAIRDRVELEGGVRPQGPIRMLTHLRYFGYCFNPVTFYYCFDPTGERVQTIVAEITNTPWNERHAYVLADQLNIGHGRTKRYRFDKRFHVSPFMSMETGYDWRFTTPGEQLHVHMENWTDGHKQFDATLALERHVIRGATLARALMAFPLMTLQVIAGIYWQALRLWLKREPLYTHPQKLSHNGGVDPAKTS
jgi:DUF1365 family protein